MSRPSLIAARLGIPRNPSRSEDPEVRRAYWRELKREERRRHDRVTFAGAKTCPKRLGSGRCGGTLEDVVDRRGINRPTVHCRKCERRAQGICDLCPRRIVGSIKIGARYCPTCQRATLLAHRARHQRTERALEIARKIARKHFRAVMRGTRSKDPETRAKCLAIVEVWNRRKRERRASRKANPHNAIDPKQRKAA
jgi:hypothetical protein